MPLQGELVPGSSGAGQVKVYFGTRNDPFAIDTDNPFSVTDSRLECGCPIENGSDEDQHGDLTVNQEDMVTTQRSYFRIDRTYRSQGTHRRSIAKGDVGVDWAFTFISDYLVKDGGNVVVFRGTNRTDTFTATSDPDMFAAPLEFYEELRRNSAGNFELRSADGTLKVYAGFNDPRIPGRLIRQEDRNGNFMSFRYEFLIGSNQYVLATAVDTMGRNIQFRYYPTNDPNQGRRGRLSEIEDFRRDGSSLGRMVVYDYDVEGNLISVRYPTITGTPNGNDFPFGKTKRYHYMTDATAPVGVTGYARQRLRHNLIAIECPNETATNLDPTNPQTLGTPLGTYRETFVYGLDPGDPSSFDRVVAHTIGGTNANGVPAGASITSVYQVIGPNAAGANDPYMKLTRTDRRGNVTEYTSGPGGTVIQKQEITRGFRNNEPAAFMTQSQFNEDKEQLKVTFPEGNEITYVLDGLNPDRFQQGNVISTAHTPGPRGADQTQISTQTIYEPIYQQMTANIDPRGLDPAFSPPIADGCNRTVRDRYTTRHFFDYQEGDPSQVLPLLATELSVSEAEVQARLDAVGVTLGLGDLNGDGDVSARIGGNIIRIVEPSVSLLTGSTQAAIEGDTCQEIVTLKRYNAFGQLTSMVDPEGNQDEWSYFPETDPDGDGTLSPAPADGRTLNTITGGYLREQIRDTVSSPTRNNSTNPTPTLIRESYTYDDVGNRTSVTNGRGIRTEFFVNEHDEILQITRAADVPSVSVNEPVALTAFAYLERMVYDFNGNIVQRQVEDRFDTSNTGGFVDTAFRFDILDQEIEKTEEIDVNETLVHLSRHDANGNLTLTIAPEGNARMRTYDVRNLPFQETRGTITPTQETLGAPTGPYNPRGGMPSTTTYNYDLNGNVIEIVDAVDTDGSPGNGSVIAGAGDVTITTYDGFDRPVHTVDSVGDQRIVNYDPVSNIVKQTYRGPVGGLSPTSISGASNVDLSIGENQFDELNRNIQRDQVLFVSTGVVTQRIPDLKDAQLTPGDDRVTTRMEYDRKSRSTFQIEDDLDTYRMDYDGVDRLIKRIDPESNTVETSYDDENNVIEFRESDVSQVAGIPKEIFLTTMFYDSLNRIQQQVDNIGQSREYRYDSRDNMVATADSQGPVTGGTIVRRFYPNGADTVNAINNFGNVSLVFYDGINRVIRTDKILTSSGVGSGTSPGTNILGVKLSESELTSVLRRDLGQSGDGRISVLQDWDGNSLLTSLTDDNSNRTDYKYDNLDRQVFTTKGICDTSSGLGTLADGCGQPNSQPTIEGLIYDLDDNVTTFQDENGSIRSCDFDAINRVISCSINRATGVIGTTEQTFQYDGLSRPARATDNNNPGEVTDDSVVTLAYDSLSRIIEETQKIGALSAKVISSGFRAENLKTSSTYTNGRIVDSTFDKLDRLDTIRDRGAVQNIADYDYIGINRVMQRTHEINSTRLTYLDDTGTTTVGYDGLRRPVKLRHLRTVQSLIVGFEHTYDRMNNKNIEQKLHDSTNSELYAYDSAYRLLDFQRGTLNANRTAISTPSSNSRQQQVWDLDGPGNWAELTTTEGGSSTLENRGHTSFNEISLIDEGGVSNKRSHDKNGNLTDEDVLSVGTDTYAFEWDHFNRLQRVKRKSDGAVVAVYVYDAFGRRIRKVVTNSDNLNGNTDFYYDNWRVFEEWDGTDTLIQQYVYGNYIDEVLVLDRNQNGDTTAISTSDQRLFYHQNTLYSVFALTDETGKIAEGYQYDSYGSQTLFIPGSNDVVEFGGDDLLLVNGGTAVNNPYLFQGRRYDIEHGLYYFRNRYYDSETGRFIQRDPLWDSYNMGNHYNFVGNSPVGYVDPYGLEACVTKLVSRKIGKPTITTSAWYTGTTYTKSSGFATEQYSRFRVKTGVKVEMKWKLSINPEHDEGEKKSSSQSGVFGTAYEVWALLERENILVTSLYERWCLMKKFKEPKPCEEQWPVQTRTRTKARGADDMWVKVRSWVEKTNIGKKR